MARPSVHGGGYITEAGSRFRSDVQPRLAQCVDTEGASMLPSERVLAHCLARMAASECRESRDPHCRTVLERTVGAAGDRDVSSTTPLEAEPAQAMVGKRFRNSDAFQESMDALASVIRARTGGGMSGIDGLPFTADNLRALIDDHDRVFLQQLSERGVALHDALQDIAGRVFLLQPELMDEALLAAFNDWLPDHYPASADVPLTDAQLNHLLVRLADWLNVSRA